MAASTAGAATITTNDGVLSIGTPTDAWVQSQDPNYWFVITDGSSSITIDHLSNGEALPTTAIANDQYPEVYQAFVSTLNEVFAVKALSSQTGNLQNLMQIIGTIKILKPNTKTAIQTSAATTQSQPSSNGDRVQCEYCGEWFAPGNDYRNHVMAAHSEEEE